MSLKWLVAYLMVLGLAPGSDPLHASSESAKSFPDVDQVATMDHRGLLRIDEAGFVTLGGMIAGQRVTPRTIAVPDQNMVRKQTLE